VAVLARRHLLSREVAPYTAMVAAGLMFLLFGFAFTSARMWVEDQSTVNRATLHLAPLIIVWMLLSFRAWARHLTLRPAAVPDAQEAAGAA
jgi:cytochrome b561